eukprot:749110-Hanusia_phi.AAC.3
MANRLPSFLLSKSVLAAFRCPEVGGGRKWEEYETERLLAVAVHARCSGSLHGHLCVHDDLSDCRGE